MSEEAYNSLLLALQEMREEQATTNSLLRQMVGERNLSQARFSRQTEDFQEAAYPRGNSLGDFMSSDLGKGMVSIVLTVGGMFLAKALLGPGVHPFPGMEGFKTP